jgi:uncharacterized protein YqjF (DUF2071 family)
MLLHASWEDVVFLHFVVERQPLRRRLPDPLSLDLPLGEAWISLVAMRSRGPAPLPARLLRGLPSHAQLSVRTYVSAGGERALFLLDQVVSSPTAAAAGRLVGVPQRGGSIDVQRHDDRIEVRLAERRSRRGVERTGTLSMRVRIAGATLRASRDPIGAALLERYVSFAGAPPRRTALEHSPWVIQPLEVESLAMDGLLPDGARLAAAHFGTPRVVALGVPHSLAPSFEPIAEPA